MKAPAGSWLVLDEVESTQSKAAELLLAGEDVAVVLAKHQTAGRGRFGRPWHSEPGDSLTMSLICREYADHTAPQFVGMAVAIASAGSAHCELAWPNDLVFGDQKVGGILTELLLDQDGRSVPVVGIGINLNQKAFPADIADFGTSLAKYRGGRYEAETIARGIVDRLQLLPEPNSWEEIAPIWHLFDHTPGKRYRLPTGEEALALGVGPGGQLICSVNGESTSVLAAEALFGRP